MRQDKFIINITGLFLSLTAPFFCVAATTTADYFQIDKGCGVTISGSAGSITCKAWQKGTQAMLEQADVTSCLCENSCLTVPANHYYYDSPASKHKQTNENEITLPVVLDWDNVEGWLNESGEAMYHWEGVTDGKLSLTSKYFGARSYLLEIDNTHNELNDSGSAGGIFRKILTTTEFNPTDELYPCFFNSDTVIKWRVRPCCKENGSYCLPEDQARWWTFTTSPAPEPVWPKDPDWTGEGDAKNISFKDVKLKWCHARISKEKLSWNNNVGLALSYQMRVYTNENEVVLAGQQVPAQFANLANWMRKDTPALTNPLACHYLEKQVNNTCKPEVMNPLQPLTPRNSESFYFWSHKELSNYDRQLFTKNLTYYWQLRPCFENPASGDKSCVSTGGGNWGQLWKFTTKNEAIDTPIAMSPENDPDYANSLTAKLKDLPVTLSWRVPDGANSFAYDIQKITGASAQSLVNGERRTTRSQIFFTKNGTISESEIQGFELELDTPYKWRLKSCWPSIPVGNVCDSAWSQWWYFRTTGRAPKSESLIPQGGANSLSLPVNLQWEAVPGAKSYVIDFNNEKVTVKSNQYAADYPKIDQNQIYSWTVKTCADDNGSLCGPETQKHSFMTAALGKSLDATNPGATLDNSQMGYSFSWKPVAGAHYYKFILNYSEKSDKETNSNCAVGKKMENVVSGDSISVAKKIDQLYCLGKYEWSVLACMDQACTDVGADPQIWQFEFTASGKEIKKGDTVLAVCGLGSDNPNTEWDDREACGIKHALLIVMQIINLVLFRISFILLPLLVLMTGGMFYVQFGGPELKEKVISWWKIIGWGYALLFFAWLITGVLLAIFGYHGAWWSI